MDAGAPSRSSSAYRAVDRRPRIAAECLRRNSLFKVSGFKFQVRPPDLEPETWNLKLFQAVRLVASQRKVLAQRMSLPVLGQKDAPQVRMIVKDDSKQIV